MHLQCDRIRALSREVRRFTEPVAILIPAHNEAAHLPRLLEACFEVEPAVVLVVDDASTDSTQEVLLALTAKGVARAAKGSRSAPGPSCLRVLRNQKNLGKQGAVVRGLSYLVREHPEIRAVALIDGDGQHDPGELPALAALLCRYDAVIGARSRDEMPSARRLSNWAVNASFGLLARVDFVDVQSGLRIYRRSLAAVLAEQLGETGGYGLEHESLAVLAAHAGELGRDLYLAAAPIACTYGLAESGIGAREVLTLAKKTLEEALRIRRAGQPARRERRAASRAHRTAARKRRSASGHFGAGTGLTGCVPEGVR